MMVEQVTRFVAQSIFEQYDVNYLNLDIDSIMDHDFNVDLDSSDLIQISVDIETQFNIDLSVSEISRVDTVRQLAKNVINKIMENENENT